MIGPGRRIRRGDALVVLSAIGVAIAAYLTVVAFDGNVEAFCTGVGDCHRVQDSEYARIAGVPIAALGLGMYVVLLGLALAQRMHLASGAARLVRAWSFLVAAAGALYSAYLTYLELFVIDAICEWCVASAVLVTVIAVLAWPDLRREPAGGPDA